jgi:hypothetical protein
MYSSVEPNKNFQKVKNKNKREKELNKKESGEKREKSAQLDDFILRICLESFLLEFGLNPKFSYTLGK